MRFPLLAATIALAGCAQAQPAPPGPDHPASVFAPAAVVEPISHTLDMAPPTTSSALQPGGKDGH